MSTPMVAESNTLPQEYDTDILGMTEGGQQYLSFNLAGEEYGIDILRVQEIKGWVPVTNIPNTPEYIQGVLNLRGTVVPILDLRDRFSLGHKEYTAKTVVIVVTVRRGEGEYLVGLVVDGVSDVLSVPSEDMKPTPDFGSGIHTEFISALAAVGDNMVMLLDIDLMFSDEEWASIETLE